MRPYVILPKDLQRVQYRFLIWNSKENRQTHDLREFA